MDDSKSFDIYADLDDATPRLPSSTELSADLAAARAEREALEARLQNLRSDYARAARRSGAGRRPASSS